MPRNTREWAKRKLDASVQNINWSGTHLDEVITVYKEAHPEISQPLELCQQMYVEIIAVIERTKRAF